MVGCLRFPRSRRAARKRASLEAEHTAAESEAVARAAAGADSLPSPPALARTRSVVEATAARYEARDAAAAKAPELVAIEKRIVGAKSAKLLEGYEARDAAARAVPDKVEVAGGVVGQRISGLVEGCEEKDRNAAAEPKLEKTFVQRERESILRCGEIELAGARDDVVVPSVAGG